MTMTAETNLKQRTRLHNWIDELPPRRFELVYRLVEELIEGEMDETDYLLSSSAMKERLLTARDSDEGLPVEVVREELGI
jgi:hypothetical protein